MIILKAASLLGLAVSLAGSAQAATITTMAEANNSTGPWGLPSVAAIGQVFTLDEAARIDNFSVQIDDGGTIMGAQYRIYGWNGFNATTEYVSGTGATSGNNVTTTYTFDAGNAELAAGVYVFFLQALTTGEAGWATVMPGTYSGGNFVYQDNQGDVSKWTTTPWSTFDTATDLAFQITYQPVDAEVAPVPLPAGLPLMLSGLGVFGLLARRRG